MKNLYAAVSSYTKTVVPLFDKIFIRCSLVMLVTDYKIGACELHNENLTHGKARDVRNRQNSDCKWKQCNMNTDFVRLLREGGRRCPRKMCSVINTTVKGSCAWEL
jgi:hypothetical protein